MRCLHFKPSRTTTWKQDKEVRKPGHLRGLHSGLPRTHVLEHALTWDANNPKPSRAKRSDDGFLQCRFGVWLALFLCREFSDNALKIIHASRMSASTNEVNLERRSVLPGVGEPHITGCGFRVLVVEEHLDLRKRDAFLDERRRERCPAAVR